MSGVAVFSDIDAESDLIGCDLAEKREWSEMPRRYSNGQSPTTTSVSEYGDWLPNAFKKLAKLRSMPDDWDSYGAEAPNQDSIKQAIRVLEALNKQDFPPNSVDPSAEGGVCISFRRNHRYADVECFNSGQVLAVTSINGDEVHVWEIAEIDHLINAVDKIQFFFMQ